MNFSLLMALVVEELGYTSIVPFTDVKAYLCRASIKNNKKETRELSD